LPCLTQQRSTSPSWGWLKKNQPPPILGLVNCLPGLAQQRCTSPSWGKQSKNHHPMLGLAEKKTNRPPYWGW